MECLWRHWNVGMPGHKTKVPSRQWLKLISNDQIVRLTLQSYLRWDTNTLCRGEVLRSWLIDWHLKSIVEIVVRLLVLSAGTFQLKIRSKIPAQWPRWLAWPGEKSIDSKKLPCKVHASPRSGTPAYPFTLG